MLNEDTTDEGEWAGWCTESVRGRMHYSSVHFLIDGVPECGATPPVNHEWQSESDHPRGRCKRCAAKSARALAEYCNAKADGAWRDYTS